MSSHLRYNSPFLMVRIKAIHPTVSYATKSCNDVELTTDTGTNKHKAGKELYIKETVWS